MTSTMNSTGAAAAANPRPERLAITVPEAARRLGVSNPTMYRIAGRADFPSVKVGKRILISVKALEEWIYKMSTDPMHLSIEI